MAKKQPMRKYKIYMFNDRDPIIAKTLALISDRKVKAISDASGVPTSTIYRFRKHTKRPQFATVARIGGVSGRTLGWV